MKTLKPFQHTAVKFILSRPNVLLADVMGLGKTFSAISAVECLAPLRVLIICPATIKTQWYNEIQRESLFFPDPIQVVYGRNAVITGKTVIVNYDLLTDLLPKLIKINWDAIIYDEVHYCKSMDAKRTKAVFGKGGLVHSTSRNICLTGTPILNRPIELYPMLKVLAPEVLGRENTFEKFGIKFCKGWYDGYELNVTGSSNEDELARRLKTSGFMLRRTEKDVELQLPAKRYQVFTIDGETERLNELEDLSRKAFKKQRFVDDTPIATLRRELAEKKVAKAMGQIEDIVDQVGKIVIFAYHKSVVDMLMKAFEGMAVKIDGSCSQTQRQIALKMFREFNDIKVLVGQITAAGTGLDGMQDVCSHILFVEISWTPAELTQAIARCHRMGQTKSVLIQFIIWAKSVEEHQMRTILDKQETINKIIGGS